MIKVWTTKTDSARPHEYPEATKVDIHADGHLYVLARSETAAIYAPGHWTHSKRED